MDRRHKWGEGVRGKDQHFHYTCRVCGKKAKRYDLDVLLTRAWMKYAPKLTSNIFKRFPLGRVKKALGVSYGSS